jgi:hypothetical protein
MSPFAIIPAAAANRGLNGNDWAVLHTIALHADKNGDAYPSLTTIAKVAGVFRRSVARSIKRLERLGLLERKAERQPGARWSNTRYRITQDSVCGDAIPTQDSGQGDTIPTPNSGQGDTINQTNSVSGDTMNSVTSAALTEEERLLPRKGVSVGKEKVTNGVQGDTIPSSRCGFYMTNATGFRLCGRATVAGTDRCTEHQVGASSH